LQLRYAFWLAYFGTCPGNESHLVSVGFMLCMDTTMLHLICKKGEEEF
jgi:hypothetical protein